MRPTCGDSGGINQAGNPCGSTAVYADTGRCIQHDDTRAEERELARQLQTEKVSEKVGRCQYPPCRKEVKPGRRYCTDSHRIKAKHLRQKAGPAAEVATTELPRDSRRGWVYDELLAQSLMEQLAVGALRYADAADQLDCSVAAVSRAVATWQVDQANAAAAEHWIRPDLPPLTLDTVPVWVEAFLAFRETHFRTRHGDPFVTTAYMRRWVHSIFRCLATGGRQAILSPPRHGKTELLQHVALFLICYRPNITIMWVSKSEDLAQKSVRSIMDHLENNDSLIAAFCPPGESFKPKKRGGVHPWLPSGGEFTVDTRTIAGITSPTMIALGRTSSVRNRSADLIVVDDLEDHKSTQQEHMRLATRHFFQTELESRKEDETAWFVIGSRAHVDDLYHYLLIDPEWDVIVEEAHSSECVLDPLDENIHVDCMMWPGVRSYSWMMQKFRSAEAHGERDLAEMVYLNRVVGVGMRNFTPEIIDPCFNRARPLGKRGIPAGTNLIAGLDPSHTNFQAAFLWAYEVNWEMPVPELRLFMVDIENRKGGGIAAVRESVAAWYEEYRLRHWIVEENLLKAGIREDEELSEYCAARGIWMADWTTGGEKWDQKLGVSSLAPMFRRRQIDLPYADADAQAASNLYRAQLLRFSSETKTSGSNRPSDLVMASWFPLDTMRFELDASQMGIDEGDRETPYESEDRMEGVEEWL